MKCFKINISFIILILSIIIINLVNYTHHKSLSLSKILRNLKKPKAKLKDYTKLPACNNLLWKLPKPTEPKWDDKKMRKKFIDDKEGVDKDYFNYQLQKDNFIKAHAKYTQKLEEIEHNPLPSLVLKLDQTDGKMPHTCKYTNSYRYTTDLKISMDCGLKTDIKKAIPAKYENFITVVKSVMKGANKEIRESETKGKFEKKKVFYYGVSEMKTEFVKDGLFMNSSFLQATTNVCDPLKTETKYKSSPVVLVFHTDNLSMTGISMAQCSLKSKDEVLLKRKQCFKLFEIKKKKSKNCEDDHKELDMTYVHFQKEKCDVKNDYTDF